MKNFFQLLVCVATLAMLPLLSTMRDMKDMGLDVAIQSFVEVVGEQPVAFIEDESRDCMLQLWQLCPNADWSELSRCFYKDLQVGANVLLHAQMVKIVDEYLYFCQEELQKNIKSKKSLEAIKVDLQEYQKFLSLEKSLINIDNLMLVKKRCRCVPASHCFTLCGLSDRFSSFINRSSTFSLPGDFFSVYKISAVSEPVDPLPFVVANDIVFTGISMTDGSWSWSGLAPTDFIANTTGTFLISTLFSFYDADPLGENLPWSMYFRLTLDNIAVPFSTVYITDDFGVGGGTGDFVGRQLNNTFVVTVTQVGSVLRFQAAKDVGSLFNFAGTVTTAPDSITGLVTIVRIA